MKLLTKGSSKFQSSDGFATNLKSEYTNDSSGGEGLTEPPTTTRTQGTRKLPLVRTSEGLWWKGKTKGPRGKNNRDKN